jgi:hypothetical protein
VYNGERADITTFHCYVGRLIDELWFHDIFRVDGTPLDQAEVNFIRRMTLGNVAMG